MSALLKDVVQYIRYGVLTHSVNDLEQIIRFVDGHQFSENGLPTAIRIEKHRF